MAKKFELIDANKCIADSIVGEMQRTVVKIRLSNPWKVLAHVKSVHSSAVFYIVVGGSDVMVRTSSNKEMEDKEPYVCFFTSRKENLWREAMELAEKEAERQKRKEARRVK